MLTFVSVFSVLVAGDGFTIVVFVSFFSVFSAGGFVTVVSFCSHAASRATPASKQMYFFIFMNRIRKGTQPSLWSWRRRSGFRRTCSGSRRSGRTWCGSFGFLFTSREQRGASQDADIFFHKFRSRLHSRLNSHSEQGDFSFQNGGSYFKPCASATARHVNCPSRVLIPPISAGCFLHASSKPRSASNSTYR